MSITTQHKQEILCLAHIHAVAGMAGVGLGLNTVHDYGVDGSFSPVSLRGNRRISYGIPLEFQAKSTTDWEVKDNLVIYDLESKTYNDIACRSNAESTLILILLCLPKKADCWYSITPFRTIMRNCCYWHYFKGEPVDNEKSTKRIKIPIKQLFTPESLTDLLSAEKARREAQLP